MTNTTVNNILIELTDITGFDRTAMALDAFAVAESKIEEIIQQAIAEERDRVRGEIEKRKISKNNFDLLVMEYMRSGTLDTPEFTIRVLQTDFNKTLDDLLSSLDKPLTDK